MTDSNKAITPPEILTCLKERLLTRWTLMGEIIHPVYKEYNLDVSFELLSYGRWSINCTVDSSSNPLKLPRFGLATAFSDIELNITLAVHGMSLETWLNFTTVLITNAFTVDKMTSLKNN